MDDLLKRVLSQFDSLVPFLGVAHEDPWDNRDGRTTWWVGYWVNDKDRSTSSGQPKKDENAKLVGDGKGFKAWRRGGSPPRPTRIEWLCSKMGGVEPR